MAGHPKVPLAVPTEEQNPAYREVLAALMPRDVMQGLQIRTPQPSDGSEGLGSHSEVDRIRVQLGHGLFVEARAVGEAPQLLDEFVEPMRR